MIIFCHLLNDRSGSPTVLREAINALCRTNKCVLFVGSQGRGVLEETDIPKSRFWYVRSRFRVLTLFTFFFSQIALFVSLSRRHDLSKDAIVYVNTLLPFGAMIWARITKRKLIVHVHEVSITPSLLRKFLTWCAGKCADKLIYVSKDHISRVPIAGPVSHIVANSVNPALRRQAESAARFEPRRSGLFKVLMLASNRAYKGLEEFMDLARAFSERDDIKFELVLNAELDEVREFEKLHPKSNNVCVFPRTDDPASFYSNANLVVNLSRTDQWIETFGLTLIEAMTFSIPVIAPPVGGPVEVVTHGENGYCIDSRDTQALVDTVNELSTKPELVNRMSANARLRADEFTFDRFSQQLAEIVAKTKAT